MARKGELANKLSQDSGARPGWRDAISGPPRQQEQEEPEEKKETARRKRQSSSRKRKAPIKRKTYLLTPELIEQIEIMAEEERVGINELVRFLLRTSLEMIETGEVEIPTRPATRQIVRGR